MGVIMYKGEQYGNQLDISGKVDKVTGKGLSSNDYTDTEKLKLASVENGAQVNTVTGVKGNAEADYRAGNINITPTNIGLGNVDNTSDLDKPISTATQEALDEKVDVVEGKGLSTNDYTSAEKEKLENAENVISDMSGTVTVGPAAIVTTTNAATKNVDGLILDIKPVQAGSGDPSPDNVRPITGWTGAKVTRCGKNLCPRCIDRSTSGVIFTVNDDGSVRIQSDGSNTESVFCNINLSLKNGQTYTASGISGGSSKTYQVYLQTKEGYSTSVGNITNGSKTWTQSETSPVGIYRIRVTTGAIVDTVIYPMIELGSTATEYEPYQGNIYDITFPVEAGTVYGGTLDVTKGLLTVTDANIASYNGESLPDTWISSMDVYSVGTSPTTGAQVVYKLATPVTYQFTPTQIALLSGSNTVYADCGDVTLSYWRTLPNAIESALQGKVDKVSGKGLSTEDYTTAEKTKLTNIEANAQVNTITGVKGDSESEYRTGNINITKANIGLGNVDNTSDANKPISTATQTALNNKISTSLKGAASGVAELDENGKVPTSQLPSFVDDVVEYSSLSNFPLEGEAGKIYVDTLDNKTYRWSGSGYVEISPSLALGETSATAYRGDRGKTAYDHASAKGSAFSSGLYKITTNSEGHVTGATAVTKSDITALGIPGSDTNTNTTYTLTQDSSDGHKLTFSGSDGSSETFTIPDNNTTYTLSSLGIGDVKNYDQSKAIKSITRNGTTFTYTCLDNTTGTFTQQDSDTTALTSMTGTLPIGKGGTGQTTAKDAIENLAFLGINPTGGVANDTQPFWKSKGTGYASINALNMLNDQPKQWGFLINIVKDGNIHQEFWAQPNDKHYYRGANDSFTEMPSWIPNDTTYSSLAADSGGTAVSLVTTGEKHTWNSKTSNTGTVTKVSTGAGLTGGDITTTGTVKANLTSDDKLTNTAADGTETAGRVYPVRLDKNGKLAVNVPWNNTTALTSMTGTLGIGHGGTGQTTTKDALNALIFLGINPTGGAANDTRAWWAAKGTGIAYFNQLGQLNDQPRQWGFVISIVSGDQVHQEFWGQPNDEHYRRGVNNASTEMPSWRPSDTTYSNATTSTAGLMSAEDKTKLDNMQTQIDQWKSYTQELRSAMQGYIDNLPEAPDDMN